MTILRPTILLILICSTLVSCNSYGPTRDIDFKTIKDELTNNLGVNGIEISDNENLIISFKSPFEQNQSSFDNTASIARHLVLKHYNPNVLNLDKRVIIKTVDSKAKEYTSANIIRNIQKLDLFFDQTMTHLNDLFNPEYKSDNRIILDFQKSECFNKITESGLLTAANIVGIQQSTAQIITVLIVVQCGYQQYLYVEYDNNMNIKKLDCY